MPGITREVGLDADAEPGLLLPPSQALPLQDLADAAAAHGDPFRLAQVGDQAVERPRGERQAEVGRPGQRRPDQRPDLVRRVDRRAARRLALLEPGEAVGVEALEPEPGSLGVQPQPLADLPRLAALGREQHQLRPLDPARAERARPRHPRQLGPLLGAERTDPDRHRRPPGRTPPLSYESYRMHQLSEKSTENQRFRKEIWRM